MSQEHFLLTVYGSKEDLEEVERGLISFLEGKCKWTKDIFRENIMLDRDKAKANGLAVGLAHHRAQIIDKQEKVA